MRSSIPDMTEGVAMMAFYTSRSLSGAVKDTYNACEEAGYEVDPTSAQISQVKEQSYEKVRVRSGERSFRLRFNVKEDRPPGEPALSVGCGQKIYPSEYHDPSEYPETMDKILELFCRVAIVLDADYAPLFNSRNQAVVPEGRPIDEAVEELPRMGIYSEEVIDQFGGIDAMFETPPWYTADLDGGLTIVIESDEPWLNGGWQPPTEAPYLSNAAFADPDPDPEPESESAGIDLSDPFAALAPGEHGTELGITREEIGKDFTNENIRLVRVYVGDNGDLRRIEDDSFVRKIIADGPDDRVAFIQRTLSDVPPDAREDQQVVSALLNDAIPPSFVQLDRPDGENVVTKVMALDVETNKYALLCSLGRDAQHDDFTAEDREAMETALENLAGLGDVEGIEEYIETNLL